MLCRNRTASGYVYETENIDAQKTGIGFPFILEMIRAEVAGSDLEDVQRIATSALYFGLHIGYAKNAKGLPLESPVVETDILSGL